MKVSGYYDGVVVYDEVFSSFNYGDIYYIDSPYSGVLKQDLPNVSTPYLAGKRKELIVSSPEFNNGSWRLTVPVSTYHPGSTKIDNKKVLYKDHSGTTIVIHLEQLRARHVGDMLNSTNSFQVGHLSNDLMKIISRTLTEFVDNEKERENLMTEELRLEDKLSSMDKRMDDLEKAIQEIQTAKELILKRAHRADPIAIPSDSLLPGDFDGNTLAVVPIAEIPESDEDKSNPVNAEFGVVVDFIYNNIELTDDDGDFVDINDIYAAYKDYCQSKGLTPISPIANFSKKLHKACPNLKRDRRTLNKKLVNTWGPMRLKNSAAPLVPERKPVNRISKWDKNKIKLFEKDLKKLSVARISEKYNVDGSTVYKYKKDHGIK